MNSEESRELIEKVKGILDKLDALRKAPHAFHPPDAEGAVGCKLCGKDPTEDRHEYPQDRLI